MSPKEPCLEARVAGGRPGRLRASQSAGPNATLRDANSGGGAAGSLDRGETQGTHHEGPEEA